MNIEKFDLTKKLDENNAVYFIQSVTQKYDELEDLRRGQLDDIRLVRNAIYNNTVPRLNDWSTQIELPEIYELAQTLKAHISENLYSNPEAMFDVSGTSPQTQSFANRQKAMLVDTFEQMNIQNELEKVINSIVETGESTLFIGWENRVKSVRRAQTIEEQLVVPSENGFVIEDKVVYDNAKIKHIKPEDFVFDKNSVDNWDSCIKIYKTFSTMEELIQNKSNNYLTPKKIESLKDLLSKKNKKEYEKGLEDNKLEILEYWGDIELENGELLKNWLVVIAARKEVVRFEPNPFVINPFIHANVIESPITGRGVSPLRVAIILNNISSTILNKQIDALALMMNPPYLAPKGCFKGEQEVKPGKIIEYDSALMPTPPSALSFEKALHGWDFLNYFRTTIESATGIFKNMAGNLQSQARTATELNYSVSGQAARLNMLLDSINRKIIIPMVEKTAEIIANFKIGRELICLKDRGKILFIEVDDTVRNGSYIYRYGDRKATLERKMRMQELFEVVKSFAEVPDIAQQIDWLECFKFALEQYGIENVNNFLVSKEENI